MAKFELDEQRLKDLEQQVLQDKKNKQKNSEPIQTAGKQVIGFTLTREGSLWTLWCLRDGQVFHTIPDAKAIAFNNLRLALFHHYMGEKSTITKQYLELPEDATIVYADFDDNQVIVKRPHSTSITKCISRIDTNQRQKIKIVEELGLFNG